MLPKNQHFKSVIQWSKYTICMCKSRDMLHKIARAVSFSMFWCAIRNIATRKFCVKLYTILSKL